LASTQLPGHLAALEAFTPTAVRSRAAIFFSHALAGITAGAALMRVILNLQWKWKSELFSPLVAVQDCNAPQSRDLMILGQQLDFEAKGGVRGEQKDDVHAASDDRAHGVENEVREA
tara:strand:- start:98 stop:448 length:351 start_codon:yes stop_codon:yes gene_type:complete